MKDSNYYKQNDYFIEKKLTVETHPEIKNYGKKGVFIYIIKDNVNDNRFIFISNKHYEDNTIIRSETFVLQKTAEISETIYLNKKKNKFGEIYFTVSKKKADIDLMLGKLSIRTKEKAIKIYHKYKLHSKKIALDYPNWHKDLISSYNCKSHKKKFLKEILCKNEYSPEIIEHFISTCFTLKDRSFQKFNDHTIILDEGKTGKSSMVSYISKKADNISIAGLYGSSDSKAGKFRGGLVTLTNRTIIIDEINELLEDKKADKILSILNTILENGEYNYVKQFSATIESSNQFIFMGNISDTFNFPLFLEGCVGNTQTIGRRIGIITYNLNLKGFKKGELRSPKPNQYIMAISNYMSEILNDIIMQPKFLEKLYTHKDYIDLEQYYKIEVLKMLNQCENETARSFFKSHAESIDRVFFRALKIYIFENLDDYLQNKQHYNSHTIFKILQITKEKLDLNLINLKNIIEHIQNSNITSRKTEINNIKLKTVPKSYKNIVELFFKNLEFISQNGTNYAQIPKKGDNKYLARDLKKRGVNDNLRSFLLSYGCRIEIKNNEIILGIINKRLLEEKCEGVFKEDLEVNMEEDLY